MTAGACQWRAPQRRRTSGAGGQGTRISRSRAWPARLTVRTRARPVAARCRRAERTLCAVSVRRSQDCHASHARPVRAHPHRLSPVATPALSRVRLRASRCDLSNSPDRHAELVSASIVPFDRRVRYERTKPHGRSRLRRFVVDERWILKQVQDDGARGKASSSRGATDAWTGSQPR